MRVTERAAVSAGAAARAAATRRQPTRRRSTPCARELNRLPIDGTVVIGEGERDEAPMLFIGEKVGTRPGPKVDIAVDPLEGTTLCAKDMPGSIAVMAMAQAGALLNAPDVYMDKIAIGPGYPQGIVDLDMTPEDNIHALAKAKGVEPGEITVCCSTGRATPSSSPRCRKAGAAVRLITDGDVAGIIHHRPQPETGVDLYLGPGGAPEGVLAAAALRCVGGQLQARLILDTRSQERARRARWASGSEQEIRHARARLGRRDRLRHRRHRRRAAQGRAVPPGHHRDGDDDLPFGDRHRPPHRGRAPGVRQVQAGLRAGAGRRAIQRTALVIARRRNRRGNPVFLAGIWIASLRSRRRASLKSHCPGSRSLPRQLGLSRLKRSADSS